MSNKTKITQQLIVATALDIAKESGIEMVTMANIARRLQIKSPSLYNHYLSLHDIKQAMASEAQSFLVSYLKQRLKDVETANIFKAFAFAYYQFACDNPGYYEASIIALDSSVGQSVLPSTELSQIMNDALQLYQLDDEQIIHTIRGFRSMLHGLIDLSNKGGFKLDVSLEKTLNYMIDLFVAGLNKN